MKTHPQTMAFATFVALCASYATTASCSANARPDESQTTSSFRWLASERLRADENAPKPTFVDDTAALHFESARKSYLDLTNRFSWRNLSGPFTIRILFQPTSYPSVKTPLISKWHMRSGGRAFEIGLLPDGRPFFDISGSGNWDGAGRELVGACRVLPGHTYCLAAVFDPERRMSLLVNGQHCGTVNRSVPKRSFANDTPVWLGAQPPGLRWADVAIVEVLVDTRTLTTAEISAWAQTWRKTELPTLVEAPVTHGRMDLSIVRRQVLDYCRQLQVQGRPFGALRTRPLPNAPVTLYASCDVAWTRACMGEDLMKILESTERRQWIDHINSFARPDGTYDNPNHGEMHRNGMAIGALAVLGGKQKYAVSLYDQFNDVDEIEPWLEQIRWERQWGASHLFWGGMHCYSLSNCCTPQWRTRVFQWLDANLDPDSGWWRKGVPQAGHHIEVLGGAAHIWPMYQHHQHRFPYPRQVIDSILSMQKEDGSWIGMGNYMELDALYGLAYMHSLDPDHRASDIAAAAHRHGQLVQKHYASFLSSAPHTHNLLAVVGTLALLQQLDPDHFHDDIRWSDIFSDRRFYATDRVE